MLRERADVAVVGAGPAGAATALLLARAGHRVALLDKTHFPRMKACGEYTSPQVATVLERLGVRRAVDDAGAHWLDGMRLYTGHVTWPVDYAAQGHRALAIPRAALDATLVSQAERAGARLCAGFRVEDVALEDGRVTGVRGSVAGQFARCDARLVVAADGVQSRVVRALGLAAPPPWPRRLGLVAHYGGVGLDRWGEMHVGPKGYGGLAPLGGGRVNVGLVVDLPHPGSRRSPLALFQAAIASLPALASRLERAERLDRVRGMGPLAHGVLRTSGAGWLLVGDAAGFLDPFTGDGVYESLRGAELAAALARRALADGDVSAAALAPYARLQRRAFGAKRRLAWLLQLFVHRPALLRYALERLVQRPTLAPPLIGALGGFAPASRALKPDYLARLLAP